MQGFAAETLALTVVGNAFLQGREVRGFWPDSAVFTFTKTCRFVAPQPPGLFRPALRVIAEDPLAWFETLRRDQARLFLVSERREPVRGLTDRALAGFVNGGPRWVIGATGPKGTALWEGRHEVVDKNDPARRIWGSTYVRIAENWPDGPPPSRPLADIGRDLDRALDAAGAFARKVEENTFADCFDRAKAALVAADPIFQGFNSDLAVWAPLTLDQRRLYAAVEQAWVFGAMGSWNDMSFEGERQGEYEACSERLFALLLEAIVAVVNGTMAV